MLLNESLPDPLNVLPISFVLIENVATRYICVYSVNDQLKSLKLDYILA